MKFWNSDQLTGDSTVGEFPDLYDLTYSDHCQDLGLYLRLSATARRILECGSGTGRLTCPMALEGRRIVGLENSDKMLSACRKKVAALPSGARANIMLMNGDMRYMRFFRNFDFIIIPFMSLNYACSIFDQMLVLEGLKRALVKRGTAVVELLAFSTLRQTFTNDGLARQVFSIRDPVTGGYAEMWRVCRFDSVKQIAEQDRYYKKYSKNGVLIEHCLVKLRNRYTSPDEFEHMCKLVGLRVLQTQGSHDGASLQHESKFAIFVLRNED